MRVLLVSNLFPPEFIGGYELIAYELATRLASIGHAVAVATSSLVNHTHELSEQPFVVYRSLDYAGLALDRSDPEWHKFRSGFIQLSNIAALRVIIEDFRPDRVILCNIKGLGPLGIVSFLYQIGLSSAIYLGDNAFDEAAGDPETRDAFYRLFRVGPALSALRVLAVSQGVYDETQAALRHPLGAPLFVPGWVADDLPALPPRGEGDKTRFVFSSRIAPHKGIWILLDAVQSALARGDNDFVVDVYGAGLVPEFLQRTHAAGLSEHIRHASAVGREEMIARFATYDALLFPTWHREPLGLVPFEAAAQGCIPVLTAQAGASEWLLADDCIKIERTPEGLSGGMQRVLHMAPAELEAMRRSLSDQTRKIFGARRWFPRIERAIEELPDPTYRINAKSIQDAMFAITRMWRG